MALLSARASLLFAVVSSACTVSPPAAMSMSVDSGDVADSGFDSGIVMQAPVWLTGHVELDVPLRRAMVRVHCVSGAIDGGATSDDAGAFAVEVGDAQFPCLVEVWAGQTLDGANELVLHGLAEGQSDVTVNPLSAAVLAAAFGEVPTQVFESFSKGPALDSARTYVQGQLFLGSLTTSSQLLTALERSAHSLNELLSWSAHGSPWQLTPAVPSFSWALPDTLVAPVVPVSNPMSAAKVELGHFLFFDQRLSGTGTFSCGSCHDPAKAFTDGRALAVGSTNEANTRSAQGLANVAFNPTLTWQDPRPRTLEEQMEVPLFGTHPVEMGVNDSNRFEVLERFRSDAVMMTRFAAAFPGQDNVLGWRKVIAAIAAFERTLLSGNSTYDRAIKGRGPALSASQTHGAQLFFNDAQCFRCHGNLNFSDVLTYAGGPAPELRFHNTGLFNLGGTGAFPSPNRGIFEFTAEPTDMGRFRAPSLRNIALTAPYMHDGSIATLEAVVDFYAAHGRDLTSGPNAGDGRANPFKDPIVDSISLTDQDKADLVAFLKTLTDDEFVSDPKFADPFR